MKFFFQIILINTKKFKNHTFYIKNLCSSPKKLKALEGSRIRLDFIWNSHKLILGNKEKFQKPETIPDFFYKAMYKKGLKIGWKKVHGKSLSVCYRKNSFNFNSDGLNLLVWVTHKKFELDRWIRKLFILKSRATVHCKLAILQ